jgi:hypothetical protein
MHFADVKVALEEKPLRCVCVGVDDESTPVNLAGPQGETEVRYCCRLCQKSRCRQKKQTDEVNLKRGWACKSPGKTKVGKKKWQKPPPPSAVVLFLDSGESERPCHGEKDFGG